MRVLSIAACAGKAGKTTLVETLCAAFPGRLEAVKFTTVPEDRQPAAGDAARYSGLLPLDGPFRICEEAEVLERAGTDTGRMARAGARSVHWALARPDALRLLWPALQEGRLAPEARVVTEGGAAAAFIGPDLLVFLYNPYVPREEWKDGAWRILAGADVIVTNPHHPERGHDPDAAPASVLDKVGRVQPGALRVTGDVSRHPSSWEGGEEFLERVRKALDL